MRIFRQIAFFLTFPVYTLVFSTACWLLAGIGKESSFSYRLETLWARLCLWTAGVEVRADLSALKPGQTYVFMANHQSQYDILVMFSALRNYPMRFVAKESLFKIPIFGWAMLRTGHIPVLRENSRKAMRSIDQAAEAAKRGLCMLIFPEGTRNLDTSALADFKIGGMIMALKCERPVAPLIITGSGELLPKGKIVPKPGVVRVTALDPFDATERYTLKRREEFRLWLHGHMNAAYKELRACPPA
ncbi:lysophospholipid acyltransferase family protein [Fundidesulfovibrio butyratiphilus]